MSTALPQDLVPFTCPNCSEERLIHLVSSLQEDDQALEELLRGSLNVVICDACAMATQVQQPIVFRSRDGRLVVYLNEALAKLPITDLEAQMTRVMQASLAGVPAELHPDYRITTSRTQFIEKITLHLNGLDDRILEYVKAQVYLAHEADPLREELLYDFNSPPHEVMELIVIDRITKKPQRTLSLPRAAYDNVLERIGEAGGPDFEQMFNGPYVSEIKLRPR